MNNPPWQRNYSNNNFNIQQQQQLPFQIQQHTPVIAYPQVVRNAGNSINPWANNQGIQIVATQQQQQQQQQHHHHQIIQQQHQSQLKSCIGYVTKILNDCGFVDDDIFFNFKVCKGAIPKIGERVLVEATYSLNTSFKWNATRIQIVPSASNNQSQQQSRIPPPLLSPSYSTHSSAYRSLSRKPTDHYDRKDSNRSRDREREEEAERKRRRDERERSREKRDRDRRDNSLDKHKSPVRHISPKRNSRRQKPKARYMVEIPKHKLNFTNADIFELKQRYSNLYLPSDFFFTEVKWPESFPHNHPLIIQPTAFHVMHKNVELPHPLPDNKEPNDLDYLFSAKVMLMGCPPLAEFYSKCLSEELDERDYLHPTRLINFLVGVRSRNETMAIGGPWSKALDGSNPESDPTVLIKTAIRNCKALTGIDLSKCTKWFRFMELYYHRSESTHKGKLIPARVETVVIFLPDIHSCMPTISEWTVLQNKYQEKLSSILNSCADLRTGGIAANSTSADNSNSSVVKDASKIVNKKENADSTTILEGGESNDISQFKPHLEVKTLKIQNLKEELVARNLPTTGLKPQLMARLAKALNSERNQEKKNSDDQKLEDYVETEETAPYDDEMKNFTILDETQDDETCDVDMSECVVVDVYDSKDENNTKKSESEKLIDEKERVQLERIYKLKDVPKIIVNPSKTAKSGKFDCEVMSLSVLLDYTKEDTKERSFEVSLFAELFNEMLMRDFGYNIYKCLVNLPVPKIKEEENKKEEEIKSSETMREEVTESIKENPKEEPNDASMKSNENDNERKSKHDKSLTDANERKREKSREKKASKRNYEDSDDCDSNSKRNKLTKCVLEKHLQLSFIYFDTTHCGYLYDRDIEELFQIMGLHLSRAQLRKLLSKAHLLYNYRDDILKINYRKLTDKAAENETAEENKLVSSIDDKSIQPGNSHIVPVFKEKSDINKNKTDNGNSWITHNGCLLDIDKLSDQINRSEKAREEIEVCFNDIKKQNSELQSHNSRANSKIKDLQAEVKSLTRKLNDTEDDLSSINKKYMEHHSLLLSIHDKISPIFVKSSREKERDRTNDRKKAEKKDDSKADSKKEDGRIDFKKEESKNDSRKGESKHDCKKEEYVSNIKKQIKKENDKIEKVPSNSDMLNVVDGNSLLDEIKGTLDDMVTVDHSEENIEIKTVDS